MGSCSNPESSVGANAGEAVDERAAYQLLEFLLRLFFDDFVFSRLSRSYMF